ncbi:MAG: GntR family transcriptional regulator [Spirochaetales bacterium]
MHKKVYRTISEQIAERLRHEILSNEMPEGTPLKEMDIAKRFGVSRGPVREALKELVRSGLISPRGRAGFQVAQHPTGEGMQLIVELRRQIEEFVLIRVVKDFEEADVERLRQILDRQHKACKEGNILAVRETDIAFHEFFIRKFGESHIEEIWRSILSRMMMRYNRHKDLMDNYREHKKILECIENSDMDCLLSAIRENIQ